MTPEEIASLEAEIASLKEQLDAALAELEALKAPNAAESSEAAAAMVAEKSALYADLSKKYLDLNAKRQNDLVAKMAKMQTTHDEALTRVKTLEDIVAKSAGTKSNEDTHAAVKMAFKALVKSVKGGDALTDEEKKAYNTFTNVDGGFLCPTEYSKELIKDIEEYSALRGVVTVKTTSAKDVEIPKRTSILKAYWKHEAEELTESQSKYGTMTITPHALTALSIASQESLEDAEFDLAAEIRSDTAEAFAVSEGKAFVLGEGDSKNQPYGFLTDPNVAVVTATSSEAAQHSFSWKDLLDLVKTVPSAYARNAIFAMSRETLIEMMKMTDDNGNPIWQSGIATGRPNTILGYGYIELPDMPSIGRANAKPVVFADFRQFYRIVDRSDVTITVDATTLAHKRQIRFITSKRVGGAVVQPKAGAILKVKA